MARSNEETVSGYFRKIFAENPKLLRGRSNQELLDRWLKDHPGQKEVPAKVKANLSNVKSVLRKKMRKGGRPKKVVDASAQSAAPVAPGDTRASRLEQLEEQIDECLGVARGIDREGLQRVIGLLRESRNALVRRAAGG